MTKKQKKMLVRIIITAVMLVGLKFIPLTGIPQLAAYLIAYLVIGYDILKKAGKGILNEMCIRDSCCSCCMMRPASAAPSGVDMTRRRSCTSCAVLPDSACCAACWSVWPPSLPESSCSRRCPSGERSTDCSASGFCRSRLASSFWFMERHLPFFPWDSICRGGGKRDARHRCV